MKIPQKAYWLSALSLLGFWSLHHFYLDQPLTGLIFLCTWTLFCIGQTIASLEQMLDQQHLQATHKGSAISTPSLLARLSLNLETEAIKRFRLLVPFLPAQCRVFRELNGNSIVLCFDFTDCPAALTVNLEQFHLLVVASTSLGLAESLIFKVNDLIVHKFIPT